ncbi:MAG: hypothetical protein ACOYCA_04655 [Eggerthellaceae bacterium]|jgi:hypothetical protein
MANQNNSPGLIPPKPSGDFPEISQEEFRQLKKSRNLVLAANIIGPVSIIIGGVILSGIGIICALVANSRLKKQENLPGDAGITAQIMRRSNKFGLYICIGAFALNLITAIMFYPMMLEAMQTGDYSNIFGGSSSGSEAASNPQTSTWG